MAMDFDERKMRLRKDEFLGRVGSDGSLHAGRKIFKKGDGW